MRTARVLHRVLNELESGKADRIEGNVIGAARIANGDGGSAQIPEWRQPGFENRAHHIVALQIYAADTAGAVIEVEIAGEFGVLRFALHVGGIGEMILHVGAGSDQSLLLGAPERNAHGAGP